MNQHPIMHLLPLGRLLFLWAAAAEAFVPPGGAIRYRTMANYRQYPIANFRIMASSTTTIGMASTQDEATASTSTSLPSELTTKALAQVYPAMLAHQAEFGNPNIPLGTAEGRQCNILRSMQIQGKLTPAEVSLLEDMGFIFRALEDVYQYVDFDELFARLKQYRVDHNGDLDIKKKYAPDPELGAWVTGIRRLGKDGVSKEHAQQLDEVGFVWVSSRKCGGKFMQQYRDLKKRLGDNMEDRDAVFADLEVGKFVRAQKEAYNRNVLSEARIEYMTRLMGDAWWK